MRTSYLMRVCVRDVEMNVFVKSQSMSGLSIEVVRTCEFFFSRIFFSSRELAITVLNLVNSSIFRYFLVLNLKTHSNVSVADMYAVKKR